MFSAKIYFSDKSTVTVNEGDFIIPIVSAKTSSEDASGESVSMGKPIDLCGHSYHGLIPALATALYSCPFFYIGSNPDTVYGTGSIVKIENL